MLKLLTIIVAIFVFSSSSEAALTAAQFATAMGNSATYQEALFGSANVKASVLMSQYVQSGWYVSNGVEILGPAGSYTNQLAAPLVSVIGSSPTKIVAKKALGLLGPVATAVTIGMTLKDLYDLANANKTEFPLTEALTHNDGGFLPVTTDSIIGETVVFPWGGGQGLISSKAQSSPTPNNPALYGAVSSPSTLSSGPPQVLQRTVYGQANSDGAGYMKTCVFVYTVSTALAPPPTPLTIQDFENAMSNPDGTIKTSLLPEIDKALKSGLNSGNSVMYPSSTQIKDLANKTVLGQAPISQAASTTAASTAFDAKKSAWQVAAALLASDPTNATKIQNEASAFADMMVAQAVKAKEEAVQADQEANVVKDEILLQPPIPSNEYDSVIDPPAKKEIPTLLESFVSSSPLVSMVRSFQITASNGACSMPVGNIYGQDLTFDFCRYESTLSSLGGVLIIIMSGFSVLIVIRGW